MIARHDALAAGSPALPGLVLAVGLLSLRWAIRDWRRGWDR